MLLWTWGNPARLEAAPLYPCDMYQVLAAQGGSVSPPGGITEQPLFDPVTVGVVAGLDPLLAASLAEQVVLRSGTPLTDAQLTAIAGAGYVDIHPDCQVMAMSTSTAAQTTSGNSASGGPGAVPSDRWQEPGYEEALTGMGAVRRAFLKYWNSIGISQRMPMRVAVLDTGIQATGALPVLTEGWGAVDRNTGMIMNHLEDHAGHGSGVASLLSRSAGPAVSLLSIRVLDDHGRGYISGLAQGILEAVFRHQAEVLNLSLAFRDTAEGQLPPALALAFQAASRQGVVTFVAAGNRFTFQEPLESQRFLPASSVEGLPLYGVGGRHFSGLTSEQSVEHPLLRAFAPSEQLCVADVASPALLTTQRISGTSLAVPQWVAFYAMLGAYQKMRGNTPTSWKPQLAEALLSGKKGEGVDLKGCTINADLAGHPLFEPLPKLQCRERRSIRAIQIWQGGCVEPVRRSGALQPSPGPYEWVGMAEQLELYAPPGSVVPDDGYWATWAEGLASAPFMIGCASCDTRRSTSSNTLIFQYDALQAQGLSNMHLRLRSGSAAYYVPLNNLPGTLWSDPTGQLFLRGKLTLQLPSTLLNAPVTSVWLMFTLETPSPETLEWAGTPLLHQELP